MKWERVRGKKHREVALIANWLRLEVDRLNDGTWRVSVGGHMMFGEYYPTIVQAKVAAWNEAARKIDAAHAAMLYGNGE